MKETIAADSSTTNRKQAGRRSLTFNTADAHRIRRASEVVRDLVELEVAVLPPRPLALRAFGVSKSTEDRRNRHEEATRREGRHGLGGVGESAACADPAGARRARRGGAGGAARAQRRCRARRRA